MSLRCLLIDDEKHALDLLKGYVEQTPGLEIAGCFTDPVKALSVISTAARPDIAFLDVDMPGINGLDLAERLPVQTKVVYTTSYREYAADAYEQAAADYLMKPIPYERFLRCVSRVSTAVKAADPGMLFVRDVLKGFTCGLPVAEILYISASLNYLELHLTDRKVMVYGGLSDFGRKLPTGFLRIHRSFIVSVRHIHTTRPGSVILTNGAVIPIGASYSRDVKTLIRG